MYVFTSKSESKQGESSSFFREEYDDESLAIDKSLDSTSSKSDFSKYARLESTRKEGPLPKLINKNKKGRRGYGKKNRKKNIIKNINLSIVGTNAAGLKTKKESFFSLINTFKASIITVQETKHNRTGTIKIPGFQTFEKIRKNKAGGGLLTAVDEDLNPVVVSHGNGNDDLEILVVEADLGSKKIRIINGYGPQEDEDIQDILSFWQDFEAEIIKAKADNCFIIVEMDANAKLGNLIIKNDPNTMTSNGKLLFDIVERQNLVIINAMNICKGTITRQRDLENRTEKSVIDYMMTCEDLAKDIVEALVDESRIHALTRYAKQKSEIKIIPSDHNILYSKFAITFTRKPRKIRKELYKFKCESSKKLFYEETTFKSKLSDCFDNSSIQSSSNKFIRALNSTVHKCFQKVRIRTGNHKKVGTESIQGKLKLRTELKIFILNHDDDSNATKEAKAKLKQIEEDLIEETAAKNAEIVREFSENMETIDGGFSNQGFWKLKRKLCPMDEDPPMAKRDSSGNIITAPEAIKNLYIDTYKDRLRNRNMNIELMDIYFLKMELWEKRNEYLKLRKTEPWNLDDLDEVLKSLKNNKSMDPKGMVSEIFKDGYIGNDLKEALLHLFNGIKSNLFIPSFMTLANITTIFKKGSRMDMNSERGIFILTVLKKMLDKLVYKDNYKEVDLRMTDSNIGSRKRRNIKDHLLIIHGIINSVLRGSDDCIDIQIYDIEKAFDALWLEDCLNDIFENLPEDNRNDKISLIYESSRTNMVAVKTPLGLTKRVNMPNIVQQGGTFGPLLCSNSIDKIGKKCMISREHTYLYKGVARILPLGFIDDLSGIAKCGLESIALNTFLTTQIELKKLKLHTTDKKGKSKCVKLHVGKNRGSCQNLSVHGKKMPEVCEESYLGDIISSDGKNTKNIKSRISKGVGIISQIIHILDEVSFGKHLFEIAMLLRESMLINGTLTNAEIWYNFSENEVKEFENLDCLFFRRLFKVPKSTPIEAFYLETGALPISIIIKGRRLNYLHITQWYNPSKGDWTEQVKADLDEFNIPQDFEYIRSKSKISFKNIVKAKAKEIAFKKLQQLKVCHSKMKNISYDELKVQTYLLREDLRVEQKRALFRFRTRMADFGENFRAGREKVLCPLCTLHLDSQDMGPACPIIRRDINMSGNFSDLYNNYARKEIIEEMEKVIEYRARKKQNNPAINGPCVTVSPGTHVLLETSVS